MWPVGDAFAQGSAEPHAPTPADKNHCDYGQDVVAHGGGYIKVCEGIQSAGSAATRAVYAKKGFGWA